MRSVLTRDDRLTGGGLLTNLECQRFAQHYGFRVRVCRPYRAQTKGKVERPIRYLRGTRQEFDHRRQSGDPFGATVLREPRLEVVGKTPGDS